MSKKSINENHNANQEKFIPFESKLKSLLNKATILSSSSSSSLVSIISKGQKKDCNSNHTFHSICKNPPDEANFALGSQIAITYSSMYFQCCLDDYTIITNDNHNMKNDNTYKKNVEKLKSKWKQIGMNFIQNIFMMTKNDNDDDNNKGSYGHSASSVDEALITSFFHSFGHENINEFQKYVSNNNKNKQDFYLALDDICYWWTTVIGIFDQQQQQIPQHSALLTSSIQSYIQFVHSLHNDVILSSSLLIQLTTSSFDTDEDQYQIVRLYSYKLQQLSSRHYFIHQLVLTLFHKRKNENSSSLLIRSNFDYFITPLIKKIVALLSSSSIPKVIMEEENHLSHLITTMIQECSFLNLQNVSYYHCESQKGQYSTHNNECKEILSWMINICFNKLLIPFQSLSQHRETSGLVVSMIDFDCQLCDVLTKVILYALVDNTQGQDIEYKHHDSEKHLIQDFLTMALVHIYNSNVINVSKYSTSIVCKGPIQTLLIRIKNLLAICNEERISSWDLVISRSALYHLIMTTLFSNDQDDITLLLDILSLLTILFERSGSNNADDILVSALHCVGHIFLNSSMELELCYSAKSIIQVTAEMLRRKSSSNCKNVQENISYNHFQIRDSFLQSATTTQNLDLLKLLTKDMQSSAISFSNIEQCEMLIFGLSSLVHVTFLRSGYDSSLVEAIYFYLNEFLLTYPQLGRRSLPVLKVTFQNFISTQQICGVQSLLEFICNCVARDASCAHEVWVMVSSLLDPLSASIRVQSMVLRLYPILCDTNKRLYGRICESLGRYVSHPSNELRVIAASSICELAQRDLIRDVSDVIGWVQSFLADQEDMIVYYAVLSLHHLVLSGELDYTIVLKVLNKKLVKFDENINDVLALNHIIIEALVKLLGDGETDNGDDSSNDSEDEKNYEKNVAPHIRLSITILCMLAMDLLPSMINLDEVENSKVVILTEIFKSLSDYSIRNFEIDEDLICVDDNIENRYTQLRQVVDGGNRLCSSSEFFSDKNTTFVDAVKALTLKLEQIEHQSPASLRWIKQHRVLAK